jgi:hypothetical protein
MLHRLRNLFVHPIDRQDDKCSAAARAVAEQASEVQFHKTLVDVYAKLANEIDPYTDWNAFAQYKNKWKDNQDELQIETRRLNERRATLEAHLRKLTELRKA